MTNPEPDSPRRCATCGRPIPRGHAGGACPSCLLDTVLGGEPPAAPESPPAEPMPGRLGEYEILGEIGRGAMGVVYRARDRRLNRVVALKTLHVAALRRDEAYHRFQIEARAVARLDHPHIVPLYELGRHAGTHFIALRLFERGSLADALRRGRPAPAEACRIVAVAARAIGHAHSRGVLHRDVKPSNLLMDESGAPHVADFGLAKLADEDDGLTLSTSVLGTPAYMAPEQAAGNVVAIGVAADVYSLGAVLFELLAGRPPFVAAGALEVLRLVADAEPPALRGLVPGLDRDLEAVCLKCLEKDPERRYPAATALADDLERWLRREPISVRPPSPSERAAKWVRRRPVVAGLAAACVLAATLGVAGIAWQWRRAAATARVARAHEQVARRNAYLADMILAGRAHDRGDWPEVREALARTTPGTGEPDFRGWEWRYLWGASRSDAVPFRGQGPGPVYSIAVLGDGGQLAVGYRESGFEIWDVAARRRVYALPDAINRVIDQGHVAGNIVACRVAAVPGTGLLAYTDCRSQTNGFVRLWDVRTRSVVRSLPVPWIPRHLAASPDGRRVACSTMGYDNRVLVFDVATGALERTIRSARFPDYAGGDSLAFAADGSAVTVEEFTADGRCALRVVDVATGEDRLRLPLGGDYALGTSVSADGRWLAASVGFDEVWLNVWELPSGRRVLRRSMDAACIRFDPSGRRLLAGASVLAAPGFGEERALEGGWGRFHAAAFLPDGRTVVTPDAGEGHLLAWDLVAPPRRRSGKTIGIPTTTLAWLDGGRGAFLVATNGTCHEVLAPGLTARALPALGDDATACASLGPGRGIAVARRGGVVTLHRGDDHGMSGSIAAGPGPIAGLVGMGTRDLLGVARDGGAGSQTLEFWDLATRAKIWEAPLPVADRIFRVAPTDGVVYQTFTDHLLGFDPASRRVFRRDLDHPGALRISFSPDGRWAFDDGTARLLDAATLRTVARVPEITMHGVAFCPGEDRLMASGGRVLDVESRRQLLRLRADYSFLQFPSMSPDGSLRAEFVNNVRHVVMWRAPSWDEINREAAEARTASP